jgi:hypothetical protein
VEEVRRGGGRRNEACACALSEGPRQLTVSALPFKKKKKRNETGTSLCVFDKTRLGWEWELLRELLHQLMCLPSPSVYVHQLSYQNKREKGEAAAEEKKSCILLLAPLLYLSQTQGWYFIN